MSQSVDDIITLPRMLKRVPGLLMDLPTMIKGVRMGANTDPTVPVGLGWCVEEAVKKNPHGLAIAYQDTRITYSQFNEWANHIAHYFASIGLKKGDVVAVFIENRPELLAVCTGLAKLGAVCAMLNTQQSGKVLIHSCNLVKPKAAIVGEELVSTFNEALPSLEVNREAVYFVADTQTLVDSGKAPAGYKNLAELIRHQPAQNPATTKQINYKDALFYIYTSGTTGLPKAAIFSHGRWMKAYGGFGVMAMRLKPHDVIYVTLPFYHATAMCVCWGSALAGGAGLAMRRRFSVREFWNDVRKYRATAFGYVGELCRYLFDQPPSPTDRDHLVTKIIGNGLRPGIWTPFKDRFGIEQVIELYASSEGNVGFTNIFNFDNTVGFSPLPYALIAYDKENEAVIRGTDGFCQKVKKGEAGLLVSEITDRTPFDGYTQKDKSEGCILRDVFKKGDAYFNTGDMLRDIGFKHAQFVDRLGDTFRWKGENVSTTELENVLNGYGQIGESVCYGVEIPNTNGRAGMALLLPKVKEEDVDFAGLFQYLKANVPPFAIPVFLRVRMGELETTGTFKYKKSDLKTDGFDPAKSAGESIYVLLPGTHEYIRIDSEVHDNLLNGSYRF